MIIAIGMIFIFIVLIIILLRESSPVHYDEEIITETTVTEDKIEGELTRQWENNQPYVIDPADKAKTWLNTKDDMYEDVIGRIWKLV